jgi:hypothetical protein
MKKVFRATIFLWGISLAIISCSSGPPAPNKVVIEFLEKDMANSDTTAILAKLDVPALVQERKNEFMEAGDSLRGQRYTGDSLTADLVAGGELNNRWLAYHIIVSRVMQKGDSAEVEVSFIDAAKSVQYYNRMGLKKTKEGWKIYSFRTLQ